MTTTPKDDTGSKNQDVKESPDVKAKASWWTELLNFLWDGGFKSLIVLVTLGGAVWITVDNDKICKGAPTSTSTSTSTALVQPNPICARYFELVFMIVGGYLGLSAPSSVNSNSKTTKTDSKDSEPPKQE